jgi:CubicO group peptidase (beta-lactamase class C family)
VSVEINGFCDDRFVPLRDAFSANFADGLEIGACLALTHRGRVVADLWAGHLDAGRTRPWEKDTIVLVTSTTKIVMSIAAWIVIDRGLLDLDAPVARYWPEFAHGGKEAVTVRDVLTHQAGVPGLDPPVSLATACDWTAMTTRIAAEPHWFGGERRLCYHLHTFGFLLGELIRRVDGRRPAQFVREEIAQKAGVDFQIGLTDMSDLRRMAIPQIPEGAFDLQGIAGKLYDTIRFSDLGSLESLVAELPSSNGYTNARAIARACAIVANGGALDGIRYLSAPTIAAAGAEQAYGQCPYLGWIRIGLGMGIHSKEFPAPSPTSMHWGGFGGSMGLMDPRAGVSFGYALNNFVVPSLTNGQIEPDLRQQRFLRVLTDLLPTL